ncbi:MAG: Tim44 domain-containing protein [Hyphomicrobiaceae bacterium]|nr:Tim44 domain-containing protein [Hyphomicrobiaceae bacterium]
MDGKIDLITLISLIVALVVIFKLRGILGRRNDEDDARLERYRAERRKAAASGAGKSDEKVVTMPQREPAPVRPAADVNVAVAETKARIHTASGSNAEVERGLLDILRLDPQFDPEPFIRGAKQAYELIVTAFAEGNRKLLRDLLSREVYDSFHMAIADRESRGEQVDQSFVGISKADIVDAELKDGVAHVTVRFVSQLISATRDRSGAVTTGDPQTIREVTDIWMFSRDVSTPRARSNPNWKLVATQAPG